MRLSQEDIFYCRPVLARGCHLRDFNILIPEGLIKLNASASRLIRLCDGQRSLSEILAELHEKHTEPCAEQIKSDVEKFILRLVERKVLDLL